MTSTIFTRTMATSATVKWTMLMSTKVDVDHVDDHVDNHHVVHNVEVHHVNVHHDEVDHVEHHDVDFSPCGRPPW